MIILKCHYLLLLKDFQIYYSLLYAKWPSSVQNDASTEIYIGKIFYKIKKYSFISSNNFILILMGKLSTYDFHTDLKQCLGSINYHINTMLKSNY